MNLLRTRSSFIARLVLASVVLTVVTSGVALPASKPKPLVDAKLTTLADGVAAPGFTKTVHASTPTEMVGFSWKGREAGTVEMRVRRNGAWSPWSEVDAGLNEGPDVGAKEYRTDRTTAGPVWVGTGVQDVQSRVKVGSLRGLRVHAIRTEEPSSKGIQSAAAIPQMPAMFSRAAWGADESWRTYASGCNGTPDYADKVTFSVLHHTDNSNNYGPGDSASIVRGIYYFHTHTNGWCDIGYNFLVDRYGQVFEGRAGGVGNAVIGAHAGGFNTRSTGVAIIGELQDAPIPAAAYDATRRLLAWKLALHHVNANSQTTTTAEAFNGSNYPAGTQVKLWTISGHRDLDQTSCPGDIGYSALGALRRDVQNLIASLPSFPAVVRGPNFYLRSSQTSGAATAGYAYGNPGDVALMCDWNGDGVKTPGVFRNGWFYLRNSNNAGVADVSFPYGNSGDKPICGDWNGDGIDTVGVVRNSGGLVGGGGNTWYLRNSNNSGNADISFSYGNSGDVPIVGDWDGDRIDSPGVVRNGTWYLRNSNTSGTADGTFAYGNTGDLPVVGDWNTDGFDTPGIMRGFTWYLRDSNNAGVADRSFQFGNSGDLPRSW